MNKHIIISSAILNAIKYALQYRCAVPHVKGLNVFLFEKTLFAVMAGTSLKPAKLTRSSCWHYQLMPE